MTFITRPSGPSWGVISPGKRAVRRFSTRFILSKGPKGAEEDELPDSGNRNPALTASG
jgi:hypothetical protein